MAPPDVIAASRAPRRAAKAIVDAIVMKEDAAAAARCRDAFADHREHLVEVAARQVAVRLCCAHERVEVVSVRHSSLAQAATSCCARMSSGADGIASRSISPLRIARTSAPHSINSSRVVANRTPFGVAPTQWPERPMRCNPTAIERGDPIWTTRSTEPTSMPSSSEAVATTARSAPSLRRDSARKRRLRDRLP